MLQDRQANCANDRLNLKWQNTNDKSGGMCLAKDIIHENTRFLVSCQLPYNESLIVADFDLLLNKA